MLATNLLIGLSFSILTNFPGIREVDAQLPKTWQEFDKIVVSSPRSPFDVSFMQKDGTIYRIFNGAVCMIETPKSYYRAQGDRPLASYYGDNRVPKEKMVAQIQAVAGRLVKSGNPLSQAPVVRSQKPHQKHPIPFHQVTFPASQTNADYAYSATFEVDGRSGKIVWLELWDPGFYDFAKAAAISNAVWTPPPPKPKPPPRHVAPFIPQATVERQLKSWRTFAQLCGLKADEVGYAEVNWSRALLYTNAAFGAAVPVNQLWFKNGLCFESHQGNVFSGYAADSCFNPGWPLRETEDWWQFHGKINCRWEDLARQFEKRLRAQGIRQADFKGSKPSCLFKPLKLGETGVRRALVTWQIWPKRVGAISVEEAKDVFHVEFDLEDGQIKGVRFFPKYGRDIWDKLMGNKAGKP